MEIVLRDAGEVWRSRGRIPEPVPPYVVQALASTYGTGKVGVVIIRTDEDRVQAHELIALMRRAARQMGRRLAIQPAPASITDRFAYRLVDRVARS